LQDNIYFVGETTDSYLSLKGRGEREDDRVSFEMVKV
jgi:hypothetical protein